MKISAHLLRLKLLLLAGMATLLFPARVHALPAFPGAAGGGAVAVGGRGGRVIEVTNLNDSGPGSLRAALRATGPRTVVFRVGGTITLQSQIVIDTSFLTIAGQTAPGDGILIRSSEGMRYSPLLMKNCHDIIIRHIRVRPGPYAQDQAGDAINTYEHVHNVIIDHCSLSWSTDENSEVWTKAEPGYNITWSWNIIAEGLNMNHSHSCGLLAGSNDNAEGMLNFSVHHNFFAHNSRRNPNLKVKSAEIINNLIWGWKDYATQIGGGTMIDIIGNRYVGQDGLTSTRREVLWKPYNPSPVVYGHPVDPASTGPAGNPSIYFSGNIGPHNSDPDTDAWHLMMEMTDLDGWGYPDDDGHPDRTDIPEQYRRFSRQTTPFPVSVASALVLDDLLLAPLGVGASMRLNENGTMTASRDSVDARIISQYRAGTGSIPNLSPDEVGGYPIMADGVPYADQDHDGMADAWERAHGLDPGDPRDGNQTNLSAEGYTNLEVFLNALPVAGPVTGPPAPLSRASQTPIYLLLR